MKRFFCQYLSIVLLLFVVLMYGYHSDDTGKVASLLTFVAGLLFTCKVTLLTGFIIYVVLFLHPQVHSVDLRLRKKFAEMILKRLMAEIHAINSKYGRYESTLPEQLIYKARKELFDAIQNFRIDAERILSPSEHIRLAPVEEIYNISIDDMEKVQESGYANVNLDVQIKVINYLYNPLAYDPNIIHLSVCRLCIRSPRLKDSPQRPRLTFALIYLIKHLKMVYMPKLRSGKIAPLPWQITLFYKVGITWPLEDNASTLTKVIDYFKSSFVLVLYLYFGLSQFAFICLHTDNVGEMVACVAYFLNCTEVLLRTIALVLKKLSFKDILDKFYANIYLERVESVQLKRYMDRHIWPTRMSSYFMLLTLICFWAMPIYSISKGLTTLPFPVVFLYDYTQLHWYIISSLQMCLMASIIGAHLIAESNMIATFVSHLNGRYIILQEDIKQLFADRSLQKSDNVNVSETFHQRLKRFYRQNEELNRFCQQIQKLYSLTFFIIFLNNVFLLCILSFKIATAKDVSGAVSYIFWLLSKVIDLVIIGKLGAALEDTTNNMSYIYYRCNWELVIMKKSSCEDNLKLLKFIRMAITLNQKPITINGGNFFNVNLELVLSILKGAGSYFAFLYNFRE